MAKSIACDAQRVGVDVGRGGLGAKTFETEKECDRAVLVGVNCSCDGLDELASLCDTCGIMTVGRVTQNIKDIDVTYYIGRGKVDEVRACVTENGATCVVFDVELSGSKVRNLEDAIGVAVLDRSKIILDIFAGRAQTAEGKLQVELAQLKYNLPRLIGAGGLMSKMKSSVGMRGPGEKKLETDKRRVHDEINFLEKRLTELKKTRGVASTQAKKSGKARVCLVGYTNSGKSTLFNTLTKAGVLAEDKLFATLDPKTANVYIKGTDDAGVGIQILLTDTVGFIDRLPHEFIRAFESTLSSVTDADLLLHIVDVSNQNFEKQIEVVNGVLKNIGAGGIPTIIVYNKIDKAGGGVVGDVVAISAKNNTNIELLKQKIVAILDKGESK